MTEACPPPPVINGARVLEYAVLDEPVTFSGHSGLFVDGKEIEPVPCLAVCQNLEDREILLLHCDREWRVLGVAAYPSAAEAKRKAERIYPGLSSRWKETGVTEAEALEYAAKIWGDLRCSFCGRTPDQVSAMIEKQGVRICNLCVAEFQQSLGRT
jgi:hypothetical protein